MLGNRIDDPEQVEEGGSIKGLGLLDVQTVLSAQKKRKQVSGRLGTVKGALSRLSGYEIKGYEIHMGETDSDKGFLTCNKNVYGSYVHGFFDCGDLAAQVADVLAERKGIVLQGERQTDYQSFKESQYDKLAETVRKHMDMDAVYGMLREVKDAWR